MRSIGGVIGRDGGVGGSGVGGVLGSTACSCGRSGGGRTGHEAMPTVSGVVGWSPCAIVVVVVVLVV